MIYVGRAQPILGGYNPGLVFLGSERTKAEQVILSMPESSTHPLMASLSALVSRFLPGLSFCLGFPQWIVIKDK